VMKAVFGASTLLASSSSLIDTAEAQYHDRYYSHEVVPAHFDQSRHYRAARGHD